MLITKYDSSKEVFLCRREGKAIDWAREREFKGMKEYHLINDAIYVPRKYSEKILPIVKSGKIKQSDCNKLFRKFRNVYSNEFGGRVFILGFDESVGYSQKIGKIEEFENLDGFEDAF
jgi:hypothetical protein